MSTEITDTRAKTLGWLFYDGDCPLCGKSARRFATVLARRGFELRTLQSPGTSQWLGLGQQDLLREIRLLLADGRNLGGADAVVEIARCIWWGWPLWLISRLPGARAVLHTAYRVLAANRHCLGGECKIPRGHAGKRAGGNERKQTRTGRLHRRHAAFFELP